MDYLEWVRIAAVHRGRRRRWSVALVIGASAALIDPAAAGLGAASDGQHLWVVSVTGGAPTSTLYHRSAADEPNTLLKITTLPGRATPLGLAAADSTAWLVSEGAVQSVTVSQSPLDGVWDSAHNLEPALPAGSRLRALAASPSGPWALLRIETTLALAKIDHPAATEASSDAEAPETENLRSIVVGLPPGLRLDTPVVDQPAPFDEAGEGSTGPTEPVRPAARSADRDATVDVGPDLGAKTEPAVPVDRLMRLDRGRWRRIDLPSDWPDGEPAWLIVQHPTDKFPLLLAQCQSSQGEAALRVYRRDGHRWRTGSHELAVGGSFVPLAVQGQLALCRAQVGVDAVEVAVSVLRQGRESWTGRLRIDAPALESWAVVPVESSVALIVQRASDSDQRGTAPPSHEPLNLRWARLNLMGPLVQEPTDLYPQKQRLRVGPAQVVIMASVLALTILMVFRFWRRDLRWSRVDLPPTLVLGDLSRRVLAGAIDLAPPFIVSMVVYQLDPEQLLLQWPGRVGGFEAMQPGALVIGLFLAHTTVGEWLTCRTIGKALVHLRVATMNGEQPRAWQMLVRGGLKALDLIAPLIMILPLVGPHRQRLGDLMARTVVVQPTKPEDKGGSADE